MNRFLKSLLTRAAVIVKIFVCGLSIVFVGCGAAAVPTAAPPTAAPVAPAIAQPTAAPAQPFEPAFAATSAPAATRRAQAASQQATPIGSASNTAQDLDRKIIKTSQLTVVVENADTAIFQFTGIVSDVGGYIVSNRIFSDNKQRGATMVVAVPVDRFEETLNRVRQVPKQIVQDFISSSDVTEQFVDLEARLKNLEATAIRIRELLARAETVEDALKINLELSNIESQIEQIKGKLNALNARTSFSTITIDMREPIPTATPTPTPTPIGWRPDETVARAVQTQDRILRGLGDSAIWIGIVLLPYLLVALLIGLIARSIIVRTRRKPAP